MSPTRANLTLTGFGLLCAVFLGVLWAAAGGLVGAPAYSVTVDVANVRNLVPYTDVQIAGVPVGRVESITPVAGAQRLALRLDAGAPLHEGVTVQVSGKSLAGQSYVDLRDGTGAPLPDGTALPASAAVAPTDLRDVLAAFDEPTRAALGELVRQLGAGTGGRSGDLDALLTGLGELGRDGSTAVDAIAAQSGDLARLVDELGTLADTLDTGRGRIVDLVEHADTLAGATAGQRRAVEDSVRALPPLLASADRASGELQRLATALGPVAADLRTAAPDLDAALRELPATSADLRGSLPDLRSVLDEAPATLHRVPDAAAALSGLAPGTVELLRDVDPALRYLKPYGPEVAQFVTNFGAGIARTDEDGTNYIALQPVLSPYALRPNPFRLPPGVTADENAHPPAGSLDDRRPQGEFPRIGRDPGP